MDKKLIEFIQQLSASDSKTLSQKALKSAEEVGELAKAVLPFENAFACKHRCFDRRAILEEVADVMLTVMSIAYNLDYEYSDIEEMLKEKSLYWAELQSRDRDAKFPVPYEIHVTVKSNLIESFKEDCVKMGVKPLVLDLQNSYLATVMQEVMTSSIHVGDNVSVYKEMTGIVSTFKELGYEVVREKIETVPWHPAAPSKKHANPTMPSDCYFESHLAVLTSKDSLPNLRRIVDENEAHLSRNIFKKVDDTFFKIMVTYRRYSGVFEDFKAKADNIKAQLEDSGFTVDKTIVEFSLYDSKVSHDAAWLMSSNKI